MCNKYAPGSVTTYPSPVTIHLVSNFEQLFNRLVLHVLVLQFSIWCEPVTLEITYRIVCSSEKTSEILSSGSKKKDTQELKKAIF